MKTEGWGNTFLFSMEVRHRTDRQLHGRKDSLEK